ncbi:cysteine hydrolase family protein [Frondihabitans cladoniiphilus]|uniref:Isochorismatase family protein n=1 Tax=Frondihabitans cladoniiphilus TaxID=715785 RepID=A0ABP8VRN9_9MICO
MTNPSGADPWLVLIDMQRVFGEPGSEWFTPDYETASAGCTRLRPAFGSRVALTRFVAPSHPVGAWIPYYEDWPFALDPRLEGQYDLMPEFPIHDATVVTRTTFGKWDAESAAALGGPSSIVLAGVSTDCCVLSTALAAADAGVQVRVVADACAGVSEADHRRALDVMALYAPLITLTTVDEVLASL